MNEINILIGGQAGQGLSFLKKINTIFILQKNICPGLEVESILSLLKFQALLIVP